MESWRSRSLATALAIGVLATQLLAACGSRLGDGLPNLTSAVRTSAAPLATPVHTPVPVSDSRALGENRVTLAARATVDGVYLNPSLFVLEHSDLPVGPIYHQAGAWTGFTYVSDGTLRMVSPTSSVNVHAGEGGVIPSELWEAQNPGPGPSTYYDLFVYDYTARGLPGGFVSPKIDLRYDIAHQLRLDLVTIDADGRSEAQAHGGAEVIVVLEGAIEVREPNSEHHFVGSRTSVYVLPQTGVQLFALDAKPARVLEFFYTPDDRPFAVGLETSP